VAAISAWDYEAQPVDALEYFNGATRRLTLAMARMPEREEAVLNLVEFRRRLEQAERGGTLGEIHVARRLVDWAELLLKTIVAGENPVRRHLEFWSLRINNIGIVGVTRGLRRGGDGSRRVVPELSVA
jgi:hypothetical protein